MKKEIYDSYAKFIFVDELTDEEIEDLTIAYYRGGYANIKGELFTQGD